MTATKKIRTFLAVEVAVHQDPIPIQIAQHHLLTLAEDKVPQSAGRMLVTKAMTAMTMPKMDIPNNNQKKMLKIYQQILAFRQRQQQLRRIPKPMVTQMTTSRRAVRIPILIQKAMKTKRRKIMVQKLTKISLSPTTILSTTHRQQKLIPPQTHPQQTTIPQIQQTTAKKTRKKETQALGTRRGSTIITQPKVVRVKLEPTIWQHRTRYQRWYPSQP